MKTQSRIARIIENQKRSVMKDYFMSVAVISTLLTSAAALF